MRPATSFINALLSHSSSVDLALIAWGTFQYNRQELPVTGGLNPSRIEHLFHREAAVKSQPPQSDQPSAEDSSSASEANDQPETRAQRLARIKAEILAGTYDTEEKMEAALDRMIGRI